MVKLLKQVIEQRFGKRINRPLIPACDPKKVKLRQLSKLVLCEKLLLTSGGRFEHANESEIGQLKLLTAVCLSATYFSLGDFRRTLRCLDKYDISTS